MSFKLDVTASYKGWGTENSLSCQDRLKLHKQPTRYQNYIIPQKSKNAHGSLLYPQSNEPIKKVREVSQSILAVGEDLNSEYKNILFIL